MSAIKETLCGICFDVSSLDEPFHDDVCFPCYYEEINGDEPNYEDGDFPMYLEYDEGE